MIFWLVGSAAIGPLFASASAESTLALDKVRARLPDLVGYILFFGAPLGIVLGTVNRDRTPNQPGESKFSVSRAIVVGGLAGILGGWAFGQWMAKVNHFPLIAGLIHLSSRDAGVILHFVFAFIIGASFGMLFQRDVRGYGSCLGWGLGYGIFLLVSRANDADATLARTQLGLVLSARSGIIWITRRTYCVRPDCRGDLRHR
jgi:hypothetical protein